MEITYRIVKILEYYRKGQKQPFILQYGVLRKGLLGGFLTLLVYYGANVALHKMVMPTLLVILIKLLLLVALGYAEGFCEWQYLDAIRKSPEPSQSRAVKIYYNLYSGIIGLGLFLGIILTDFSKVQPLEALVYLGGFSVMGWLYAKFTWNTGAHILVDSIREGMEDPNGMLRKLSK